MISCKGRQISFIVLFLFFFVFNSAAQPALIKEQYSKIERMIPMRDGVQLFTAIYIPKDSSEPHPIIMTRTPYSCAPYGEDNFTYGFGNPAFVQEKYIVVYQDVRGRHMSQGRFAEMTPAISNKRSNSQVDESSDTYDTVDWLLQNIKGNNGKVGLHGISYPGFYATAALPNAHPAIKAVSPQAPVTDEFEGDDVYHRGAFFLMDNVSFLNFFDHPRNGPTKTYPLVDTLIDDLKDAFDFYLNLGPIKNINEKYFKHKSVIWDEYTGHDTKDAYWLARNIRPHLTNIKPAVLVVGGWFDAEDMFGALRTYSAIERQNQVNQNYLLMGPWTHGGWMRPTSSYATHQFSSNPSAKFFETETSFFNYFLKGKGDFKQPEATIYFTGSNEWRTFSSWPATGTKNFDLYLNSGKRLSHTPEKSRQGYEQYVSDPAKPVPYTSKKMGDRDNDYLGSDQRFAAERPDVLSFETSVLNEDVTLAGPVIARLFVTTTSTDVDFVVKVIDVLPDSAGTQQMVRAEVIRGKFRNGYTKPEPFVPGKITPVRLALNDVAHTFKAGHKIMVQVQSSWFPLVDRNPQTFVDIAEANEADFQKATIRIERNGRYQSVIQCQRL